MIGITAARPAMASARRRSPAASRKSRSATSSALRRSSFLLFPVPHDGEVDLFQSRPLDHLAVLLQPGGTGQGVDVAGGQEAAPRHDPDLAGERLRLFHVVGADDQRRAAGTELLEV